MLLSGGKDSAYLLYVLKEEYKLNVLALTIDTGFMNPMAKNNIKKIIDNLAVDHIFYRPKNEFFKKIYRYYIISPNKKTYCQTVCHLCQTIIASIGLKITAEKKIPFLAIGASPDQAPCYEIPKKEITQSWIPKELYDEYFTSEDRSYFWNPENVDKEYFPRFIFPFYVLEYPDFEKIILKLSELSLGSNKNFNPLNTNCFLVWLLIYLDIKKNGYNPYIRYIGDLIRLNKTTRNKWWLQITIGTWLLKNGFIKRKVIKRNLTFDQARNPQTLVCRTNRME